MKGNPVLEETLNTSSPDNIIPITKAKLFSVLRYMQ